VELRCKNKARGKVTPRPKKVTIKRIGGTDDEKKKRKKTMSREENAKELPEGGKRGN